MNQIKLSEEVMKNMIKYKQKRMKELKKISTKI